MRFINKWYISIWLIIIALIYTMAPVSGRGPAWDGIILFSMIASIVYNIIYFAIYFIVTRKNKI